MVKDIRRSEDGHYHIDGKKYEILMGSRAQVAHGTAYKTSGGLVAKDICMNKNGRYVSCSKSKLNKTKSNLGRLLVPKGTHRFGPWRSCKSVKKSVCKPPCSWIKSKTMKRHCRRTGRSSA